MRIRILLFSMFLAATMMAETKDDAAVKEMLNSRGEQVSPTAKPEMSACEKQMVAILKELKKKAPEKVVYEYRAVAADTTTDLNAIINPLLQSGKWELYVNPTADARAGYWLQTLIRVKP